ncbi:UDP-glycosyltransferase [Quillaja saponaria]|uniref:UDP-glycosyltransferase n=1 Tax=Quillaja saponaria TaxID=32244 RepID=A0AAD7LV38_QUISA|nr:UDP-glycosyltransferase [Quillaja saponaria]
MGLRIEPRIVGSFVKTGCLKILAHESVGAYFTHCGAGSVLGGLNFGRVLVTLPFYADQSLHERVLEEKKVGVEIPRNEQDGSFTRTSVAKSLRLAMVDEEGSIYRDKAKEMGLLFGDSHIQERYIENFIEYLQNYKLKNRVPYVIKPLISSVDFLSCQCNKTVSIKFE